MSQTVEGEQPVPGSEPESEPEPDAEAEAEAEEQRRPEPAAEFPAVETLPIPHEPSRRERRAQVRRTRVTVRRVGPISVLKLSLIFYFCLWLSVFLGLVLAFGFASGLGVVDKAAQFWGKLFSDAGASFQINGRWIFSRLFVIGSVMVVVASVFTVVVAFLYNLICDMVGGLEITLSEKR
ncbi:MAG: DUF3566 domain-containing protein [Actinobacteria bacterium]|nr:DUF3566 domain-containing protein [Actinomycetota bacterium]